MPENKQKGKKGLLTIHSHPYSFPPSIEDFNSNFSNEYGVGIICCHDGKIYIYTSDEEVKLYLKFQNYFHVEKKGKRKSKSEI